MPLEIERKFRVIGASWTPLVSRKRRLRQAYLTKNGAISIRVRIDECDRATLTMKTSQPSRKRHEYEYEIPVKDAEELLWLREGAVIEKVRHDVPIGDVTWEVDVFSGENTGLVLAEVELVSENQHFDMPPWIGEEVTHDRRYYNADLAKRPFPTW
jgi:adenylate cyclase